jgi:hypothetical protein
MKSSLAVMTALILLFSLGGCAGQPTGTAHERDGVEYGKVKGAFRSQWWNFYERGLSYAEGRFYSEAFSDLRTAAEMRETDQRMARTYGMHFIDYFPHRELGVIHYLNGRLEEARTELELSIHQFTSAKALFYLDRVRKALLEQQGREAAPPRLALRFDRDEIWTRDDPVIVAGTAEDEGYVASISVKGRSVFLEGSQKSVPFKEPLSLSQGEHVVMVEARNLLGKSASRQVLVHVDREGPTFSLDSIEEGPAGNITISGSVYDEAGVAELIIDGKPMAVKNDIEVPFTLSRPSRRGEIELVARDRLGNETSARFPVDPAASARPAVHLALAGDEQTPAMLAAFFGGKDQRPPDIKLKGWTESQTVFMEKAYLEGQISGESKITNLSVNNVPILRRKGQMIVFNHLLELREGENSVQIEAKDEAGQSAVKRISIRRQVPQAMELDERLSLSILPFEQKGAVSGTSLLFQDNLTGSLVDQKRFRVIERDKLDAILQEQKLSRTALVDRSTALRLGKLVAAHSIMTGTIVETREGVEVVARLIDTETSEILATEDVYNEVKGIEDLRSLAEGMAIKFHREFPLVDGSVIQLQKGYILTDLGKGKAALQRRLIIYREKPVKHPQTGKILGSDNTIIARAKITQVMAEMSKADLLDGKNVTIQQMDKVITE